MKNLYLILIAFLTVTVVSCQTSESDNPKTIDLNKIEKPEKLIDQFSFIFGHYLGEQLRKDSVYNINYDLFIAGIRFQLEEKQSLFKKQEADSIMQVMTEVFQKRMQDAQTRQQMLQQKDKEESMKFMLENKKKEGIFVTETGLQYEILKKGSGSSPRPKDHVKIHIVGKVLNGHEFDNSYEKDAPLMLGVESDKIIRAWFESLLKMKVGSKWRIYAPPSHAFGNNPLPPEANIPSGKILIFEIELLDFQPEPFEGEAPPPAQVQAPMPGAGGLPPMPQSGGQGPQ